jgi:hypothetical protein
LADQWRRRQHRRRLGDDGDVDNIVDAWEMLPDKEQNMYLPAGEHDDCDCHEDEDCDCEED